MLILQNVIFTVLNKLRYGKKLKLNGIQEFRSNTQITIKNGRIMLGKHTRYMDRVSLSAVAGGELLVGDNVFMNRNCIVVSQKRIQIGDQCSFGPNVIIYDHDHKFGEEGLMCGYNTGEIVIENNCWIGAGVTILRNTHIGEGCVIGAGCIIKGDIPAHSLVTSDRSVNIVPLKKRDVSEVQSESQ